MNAIVSFISSKMLPSALLVIFTGATLTTSALAVTKLMTPAAETNTHAVAAIPETNAEESSGETEPETASPPTTTPQSGSQPKPTAQSASPTGTVSPQRTPIPTPTSGARLTMGAAAIASVTAPSAATPSGGCIITLFGKQYDVASLRSTHPGGDVFVCNSDMSTTYQRQHGTDVSRMQRYLVSASGTTGTTGSSSGSVGTTGSSGTGYREDDEDHDDDDRYIENEAEHAEDREQGEVHEQEDKEDHEDVQQ